MRLSRLSSSLLLSTTCIAIVADAAPSGPQNQPSTGASTGASTGVASAGGNAGSSSTSPSMARIDPTIRAVLGLAARFGVTPPSHRPSDRLIREGVIPVVIRFSTPPSIARIAALGRAGVEWERGAAPFASGVYGAKVGAAQLKILESDPYVVRVTNDLPRASPRPLDASAVETGIASARRTFRAKDGTLIDGTGVKIADLDSGIFAFHPAFFRADGGLSSWIDVDGNGALTPDVDGIDLDASGSIDPTEVLHALIAEGVVGHTGFDPAVDHLYLDSNGNGLRDYGAAFAEDTKAFGEPLFVADDVDQNGKVQKGEKLLQLGTTKIAVARGARDYVRGTAGKGGVLAFGLSITKDPQLLDAAGHGTAVAGVLVGGVVDRSRLLGLAPGADLMAITYSRTDPKGTIGEVQWAIDHHADIILTEYAPYSGYPLDGSTEEEKLLDAAVDSGIAVVDPAGNLAGGYKHRTVKLERGANVYALKTDGYFAKGPYVGLTLLHRGDPRVLKLKLTLPDSSVIDVPALSTEAFIDVGKDRYMNVVRETSSRGTHMINVQIYGTELSGKPVPLPDGKYSLSIDADAPVEAELICEDAKNGWARGFTFEENTPSRTICHPATNDKGLTVAAYVLHDEEGFRAAGRKGELASYSSRGPRIDSVLGIDLAAPDNALSTMIPGKSQPNGVKYEVFGGTSGAGPHVVAALALLKQVHPELKGAALQNALLTTTRKDSFVSSDETLWGKGKLDVAAALGVARKEGIAPKVTLTVPSEALVAKAFEVKVVIDDDAPGSKVRWDLDYDGKPDTEWSTSLTQTLTVGDLGVRTVKVDVLDADGYLRGATANVAVVSELSNPEPAADDGGVSPAAANDTAGGGGCGCRTVDSATGAGSAVWAWGSLLMLGSIAAMRRRRRGPACDEPRPRGEVLASEANAELAILTDASAACGSQVISDGCRLVEVRRHQKGVGVAGTRAHE